MKRSAARSTARHLDRSAVDGPSEQAGRYGPDVFAQVKDVAGGDDPSLVVPSQGLTLLHPFLADVLGLDGSLDERTDEVDLAAGVRVALRRIIAASSRIARGSARAKTRSRHTPSCCSDR